VFALGTCSVERWLCGVYRTDSLYQEVVICNSLRRAADGRVAFVDLIRMLNRTIGLVDFLIQVLFT